MCTEGRKKGNHNRDTMQDIRTKYTYKSSLRDTQVLSLENWGGGLKSLAHTVYIYMHDICMLAYTVYM